MRFSRQEYWSGLPFSSPCLEVKDSIKERRATKIQTLGTIGPQIITVSVLFCFVFIFRCYNDAYVMKNREKET